MNVLVTGATGAVGPRVVHALDQAGFRIRSFSVDTPTSGMFPQSVEVLIGDVNDTSAVQSAMQGVDAVVHMAALLHIVNPPPELREKYERVNVGGTATVVEAAIKAGAKRVGDSGPNRPPIPIQIGHLFRSKSAGHSGANQPPLCWVK